MFSANNCNVQLNVTGWKQQGNAANGITCYRNEEFVKVTVYPPMYATPSETYWTTNIPSDCTPPNVFTQYDGVTEFVMRPNDSKVYRKTIDGSTINQTSSNYYVTFIYPKQ